ncbi:MAG: type II toxin-antitoxin system VapC family toxin [Acidobacteria bacterium]|nr:type II toxin-antitoxin system VapC family toxin [Acidobacteriota bacterium]
MGRPLILETSFLIDLEREHNRGAPGPAVAFLAPFYVLSSNLDVTWEYGRAYRYLQENGRLIGGNDLWIAATGLAYRMPIVTRPVEHDRRVPGLDVEKYRAPASRTQWHTGWLDAPARLPPDEPTDACMIPLLIPS